MRNRKNVTPSIIQHLEPRLCLASTTLIFVDGSGGYAGTRDTHVRLDTPDGSFGGDAAVVVDLDDNSSLQGNQPSQGLLRFDTLFGASAAQVPQGAAITAATLTLRTGTDTSDESTTPTSLHRMLADWTEASTWNSMSGGVSADGAEDGADPQRGLRDVHFFLLRSGGRPTRPLHRRRQVAKTRLSGS